MQFRGHSNPRTISAVPLTGLDGTCVPSIHFCDMVNKMGVSTAKELRVIVFMGPQAATVLNKFIDKYQVYHIKNKPR